ncbi:hypothetical protein [uncultured Rhodoblastus sp.]|uniref:hypothetical protein n=1 Tax=uncultured Rhodoblastus sp. TaxID=543037 RepID=UPI0025EBAA63|nr:hypothetical protein [uncultured Rhodoblastus sp.]
MHAFRPFPLLFGATAFALALLLGAASGAQEPQPDAADILFERPQLQALKLGDNLKYSYRFHSADEKIFGPSFDDTIALTIDRGDTPDKKRVDVQLFSAERRRAAGPFDDMAGNPLLSLMLEENLQRLATIFQSNPRYMKTAIRMALRSAKASPDRAEGFDAAAPAWKVEVAPFLNDPNKARMHGLESLTYRFRVSAAAPGEIYEIDISARDASGAVLFEETTRYDAKTP